MSQPHLSHGHVSWAVVTVLPLCGLQAVSAWTQCHHQHVKEVTVDKVVLTSAARMLKIGMMDKAVC